MYSLPAHTIYLVLQYISPLVDPLPPHLISTPLQQRHHFLQISISTPAEYLCWPSSDNAKIIDLLDRFHPLSDQTSYPTRYTSDPESTFAHVQISSSAEGLRMLFQWDDTDGWKYHDLQLMPFPCPSFSTPQESLASNFAASDLVAESDHINNADGDPYWDAYGVVGHDLTSLSPLQSVSKPDTVEAEDAYWAQYASVQGSADSTVPSPLPVDRKFRSVFPDGDLPPRPQVDPIINVPADAIHSHPLAYREGPPSPDTLAHLLSTISSRKDTYSPELAGPYSIQLPSAYSVDPSSEQTRADSELVTPPLLNECPDTGASVVPPLAYKIDGVPLSRCPPHPLDEAGDKALMDSIKGLYYLWKVGGKGELGEKDRSGFLQIVQAALAYD